MSSALKLAHVVFRTSQPEAMKNWYCEVLEAHLVYEGKGLTFLTFDEEHHRVALIASSEPLKRKAENAAWVHHSAYAVDDLDSLLRRYTRLERQGIRPVTPIQHGVTTSLYYEDPDGNLVELQVDNFTRPDDATAYMNGEEYDADPRGPLFDPEAAVAARRAGVPAVEIQTRAWAKANPA